MSAFQLIVGGVLPYLAVAVFLVGMGYRIYAWRKAPQPGKMTLTPAPQGSPVKAILAETFFFPSLLKGDKVLWGFSWVFHATLALVFVGHLRVVTGLIDGMLIGLGMTSDGVSWMSSAFGGAAGIVMLATLALLLIRRFALQRVREISGTGDYIALVLLIAIVVTGNAMRFGAEHFDLATTQAWAASLLAFSPVVPESSAFLVHALFAQLLILYIPFSKVMHFGGIFFTQALIKR